MTAVLEITDSHGNIQYCRLGSEPLTIGRGYDCDIILNDEYLSARHLLIRPGEEGLFVVEDLESENGSFAQTAEGETFSLTEKATLAFGTRLYIGKTTLIPYLSSTPVPKAKKLHRHSMGTRLGAFASWSLPLGTLLTLISLMTHLGNATTNPAEEIVQTALGILIIVGIWAGTWSFLGRLLIRQHRFFIHVGVFSSIACLAFIVDALKDAIVFSLESSSSPLWSPYRHIDILTTISYTALSLALLASHLKYATHMNARYRWIAASILPSIGLCGALLVHLAKEEAPSGASSKTSTMLPASWRLAEVQTEKDFINSLDILERLAMDEARKKKD